MSESLWEYFSWKSRTDITETIWDGFQECVDDKLKMNISLIFKNRVSVFLFLLVD